MLLLNLQQQVLEYIFDGIFLMEFLLRLFAAPSKRGTLAGLTVGPESKVGYGGAAHLLYICSVYIYIFYMFILQTVIRIVHCFVTRLK